VRCTSRWASVSEKSIIDPPGVGGELDSRPIRRWGGKLTPVMTETRYARAGDGTHVAYQVNGAGPVDIIVLRAWHSNLEHEWSDPVLAGIYRRLGSVGRVVRLDRRGTGLSDRISPASLPTLEHRIDDLRAVLDAVSSERVVLVGLAHGAAVCAVFAATYPERTAGLVLWSPPFMTVGQDDEVTSRQYLDNIESVWATEAHARRIVQIAAPSRASDEAFVKWIRLDQALSGSAADGRIQWELAASTNVDGILESIPVPTLVLWRAGSPFAGPYIAGRVPGAVGVELPGDDHVFISGDWRPGLTEMERFIERVAGLELESDRVLATVMFTDLVGSTERVVALGDAAWREVVDRHHAIVRRELAAHRGREIDTAGDGFFAEFDAPARAIRCAVTIRSGLTAIGLGVRIGLHVGECERVGDGLRGLAVNVGARIASLAASGQILTSRTVRDLVAGSEIEFVDAGRHQLKGIPEPWHLYSIGG
jgi:class 3 adenylate cyclase